VSEEITGAAPGVDASVVEVEVEVGVGVEVEVEVEWEGAGTPPPPPGRPATVVEGRADDDEGGAATLGPLPPSETARAIAPAITSPATTPTEVASHRSG
jgi:hypothetical protein